MNRTLEECAKVVLRKWPQHRECPLLPSCRSGMGYEASMCKCADGQVPITPAECSPSTTGGLASGCGHCG